MTQRSFDAWYFGSARTVSGKRITRRVQPHCYNAPAISAKVFSESLGGLESPVPAATLTRPASYRFRGDVEMFESEHFPAYGNCAEGVISRRGLDIDTTKNCRLGGPFERTRQSRAVGHGVMADSVGRNKSRCGDPYPCRPRHESYPHGGGRGANATSGVSIEAWHRASTPGATKDDDIMQRDTRPGRQQCTNWPCLPERSYPQVAAGIYRNNNSGVLGSDRYGVVIAFRSEFSHSLRVQIAAAKNYFQMRGGASDLGSANLILEPLGSSEAVLITTRKKPWRSPGEYRCFGAVPPTWLIFHEGINFRHTAVDPLGGNIIHRRTSSRLQHIKTYAAWALKSTTDRRVECWITWENKIIRYRHPRRPAEGDFAQNLSGIHHEAYVGKIFEFVDYEILNFGYKHKLSAGIVLNGRRRSVETQPSAG
ncbi:hypothetical protein FQR65_LT19724 [Abscondita terminalis]|nr:hypothetical protein FQR65_LT19724 [Abscondita terminalis]